MKNFKISILIPVFNEEENIKLIYSQISEIVKNFNYELIFINDGSIDNTEIELKNIAIKNTKIKVISFYRNFGHQMALTAGYNFASGDCVISIDADLQDPPELIIDLISKWQEGYDIVYAKRFSRKDSFFKKITAYLFYRLINTLSDIKIPKDVGDFRLLDKKVVTVLNNLPENSRFLRGLVAWGGFKYTFINFNREKRMHGKTHYPLSKMFNFALDGITSFSIKPLKILSLLGFLTALIGFLGIFYAVILRVFFTHEFWVTGWTTTFVGIMFFGGIQILAIGVIGEYIGKIYKEIQNRPQYLIKDKINL